MRRLGGFFVAVAMGASALAGCSQGSAAISAVDVDPKAIEAHVTKLAGESFKGTTTTPANLDAVKALLPAEVVMSWGNLTFDAATNSTLVTDLKLTPKDMPSMGLQIAELRLYDFDAQLLQDRVGGKRLAETAKLARRIDAKNISVFGLADAINMGTVHEMPASPETPEVINPTKFQPTDPTDPTAPVEVQPSDDPFADMQGMTMMGAPTVSRMDMSIGRMIFDDVVLKPYVTPAPPAAAADPNDPMAEVMPMLQHIVAAAQSYGVDTAAYFDYKVGFDMTEGDQKVTGDMTIKTMGARGMRGGDLDGMFIRDVNYGIKTTVEPGMAPFDFNYTLGLMTLKNLRLEKALGYLAKGVMPPRTETNLMGLGIWHSENEALTMAGQQIYTATETNFDASGFHWFIPTKLSASGKGITLNLGAFVDIAEKYSTVAPVTDDPTAVDTSAAEIAEAKAFLAKNGLNTISFDSNFDWNWNAQNGDTKLGFGIDGKDLLNVSAKYEGGFPSFKAVSDLIPETGEPNEMAIANVFQTNSSLKLIELNVQDNGGLNKIFAIMGEMSPEMTGGPAMTADQARSQAVEGVKMMARPDVSGIPELQPLMTPIADFLASGGKLRFLVQPTKPMPFSNLMGTMMAAGMGSPAQAIKDLGLKVEHTK